MILIEWDLYAVLHRRVYLVLSTTSYTITVMVSLVLLASSRRKLLKKGGVSQSKTSEKKG